MRVAGSGEDSALLCINFKLLPTTILTIFYGKFTGFYEMPFYKFILQIYMGSRYLLLTNQITAFVTTRI